MAAFFVFGERAMYSKEQRAKPGDPRRIEYRGADAEVDAEEGIVTGYLTAWWVVDSFGTAFVPPAFTKTLQERGDKLPLLLQHDPSSAIGKLANLTVDDYGLRHSSKIIDDGAEGTVTLKRLRGGVPYGQSHGFRVLDERPATAEDPLQFTDNTPEWVRRDPTSAWVITQVRAYEGSIVTFPANDLAVITSVRSDLEAQTLAQTLEDLNAGRLNPAQRSLVAEIAAAWQAAPELRQQPPRTDANARADRETALSFLAAQCGITLEQMLCAP